MVSKKSKSQIDRQQSRDIRALKRMMPTQKQVIVVSNSSSPSQNGDIYAVEPAALNDQKVLFRGIDFRCSAEIPQDSTTGCIMRYIVFLYKCSVDQSGNPATTTAPTVTDLLGSGTASTTSLINPENSSRIRVLYDGNISLTTENFQGVRHARVFLKRPLNLDAVTDKAFVMRPFVFVSSNTLSSMPATVDQSFNIHAHTTQLP